MSLYRYLLKISFRFSLLCPSSVYFLIAFISVQRIIDRSLRTQGSSVCLPETIEDDEEDDLYCPAGSCYCYESEELEALVRPPSVGCVDTLLS